MRLKGRGTVRRVAFGVSVLPLLAMVSACGRRDAVDTPVNWWHQLEGGDIAQQRPPPPGVDAPYPKVGTTPATPPVMLSPELRSSLTRTLQEQSSLSARMNASEPIAASMPPAAVLSGPGTIATGDVGQGGRSPGTGAVAAAAASPAMSSATLDAAEAPPPPPPPPVHAPAPAAELAMPDIVPEQVGAASAAESIPPIQDAPPAAPGLPGFAIPRGPSYAPVSHPDYQLERGEGEALLFPDGSDALSPGQDGTLRSLAARRGKAGIVYVHGFGDAPSDAPGQQAQALTLAALRARAVADVLRQHGVPADAIRIRAAAFGRGATAGLID